MSQSDFKELFTHPIAHEETLNETVTLIGTNKLHSPIVVVQPAFPEATNTEAVALTRPNKLYGPTVVVSASTGHTRTSPAKCPLRGLSAGG